MIVLGRKIEGTNHTRWVGRLGSMDYIECDAGSVRNEVCPECGPLRHTVYSIFDVYYSLYSLENIAYDHSMSISINSNSVKSQFTMTDEESSYTNKEFVNISFNKFVSYVDLVDRLSESYLLVPNGSLPLSSDPFTAGNLHYWALYPKSILDSNDDCDTLYFSAFNISDIDEEEFCSSSFGSCLDNQIARVLKEHPISDTQSFEAFVGEDGDGVPLSQILHSEGKLSMRTNEDYETIKTVVTISGKTPTGHRRIKEPMLVLKSSYVDHDLLSITPNMEIMNEGDISSTITAKIQCFYNGIQFEAEQVFIGSGEEINLHQRITFDPSLSGSFPCIYSAILPSPKFWSNEKKKVESIFEVDIYNGCTELTEYDAFIGADHDAWSGSDDPLAVLGADPFNLTLGEWKRSRGTFTMEVEYDVAVFSNVDKMPVKSNIVCSSDSGFVHRDLLITTEFNLNEKKTIKNTIQGNGVTAENSQLKCKLIVEIDRPDCWSIYGKHVVHTFTINAPHDVCRQHNAGFEPSVLLPLENWGKKNDFKNLVNFELVQGWQRISKNTNYSMIYTFNVTNQGFSEADFGVKAECNSSQFTMFEGKTTLLQNVDSGETKSFYVAFLSKEAVKKSNNNNGCNVTVFVAPHVYSSCWSELGKSYTQTLYLSHEQEYSGIFGIGVIESTILLSFIIVLPLIVVITVSTIAIRKRLKKNSIWGGMSQVDAEMINKKYISNETRDYSEINRMSQPVVVAGAGTIKSASYDSTTESVSELKTGVTVVENTAGNRKTVIDDEVPSDGNVYEAPVHRSMLPKDKNSCEDELSTDMFERNLENGDVMFSDAFNMEASTSNDFPDE